MKAPALTRSLLLGGCALLSHHAAFAQDQQAGNAAAQANNPLADMTAFNIQDYYIGDLTESDESANQAWLRFAKPFSVSDTDWIFLSLIHI